MTSDIKGETRLKVLGNRVLRGTFEPNNERLEKIAQ
jgi:hypothetical protein